MKRAAILLLVSIASIGASWAAFQALASRTRLRFLRYVPAGPLLYCRPRIFPRCSATGTPRRQKPAG